MQTLTRSVNFLPGINGVAASSVATLQMPVGVRYHRLVLNCVAVNYTLPQVKLIGAGVYNATLTPTVVNGQITAVAITAAGSGMTNGAYTSAGGGVQITDATGVGAQLSITVAGGAVTVVTVVSGGQPGPINPAAMIVNMRIAVNNVVIRDITPQQCMAIQVASGYLPQFGSLPIWFTEPRRNFLRDNELTSWDLAGQSTFQIQFNLAAGLVSPGISGTMEFDYNRNARPIRNATQLAAAISKGLLPSGTTLATNPKVPFLQIVSQHAATFSVNNGLNVITTLPWNTPITRIWLQGSAPGNLYQFEVQSGNNLLYQATAQQMYELASEYQFNVGNTFWGPAGAGGMYGGGSPGNGGVTTTTNAQSPMTVPNGRLADSPWLSGTELFPLDAAIIFDPDNRPWKSMRNTGAFKLNVWSAAAQNLTVLVESISGSFSG